MAVISTWPLTDPSIILRSRVRSGSFKQWLLIFCLVLTATQLSWPWTAFGAAHKGRRTPVRKAAAPAPGFCLLPWQGCLCWVLIGSGLQWSQWLSTWLRFSRASQPFISIIWGEEVCVCFPAWQEITHHLTQEQPSPEVCLWSPSCISLKPRGPALWPGDGGGCWQKALLFSFVPFCFLLEQARFRPQSSSCCDIEACGSVKCWRWAGGFTGYQRTRSSHISRGMLQRLRCSLDISTMFLWGKKEGLSL